MASTPGDKDKDMQPTQGSSKKIQQKRKRRPQDDESSDDPPMNKQQTKRMTLDKTRSLRLNKKTFTAKKGISRISSKKSPITSDPPVHAKIGSKKKEETKAAQRETRKHGSTKKATRIIPLKKKPITFTSIEDLFERRRIEEKLGSSTDSDEDSI